MTSHIETIVAEKTKRDTDLYAADLALAKKGELTGSYKVNVNAAIRESKELDSPKVGLLEKGQTVEVVECAVLPGDKIRVRQATGWCVRWTRKCLAAWRCGTRRTRWII